MAIGADNGPACGSTGAGEASGAYTVSSGRQKLLGISKRGNRYLRTLFVQCARAVLQQRNKHSTRLSEWLGQLTVRAHRNVVCVTLANKLARIAWAVLATGQAYRPAAVPVAEAA